MNSWDNKISKLQPGMVAVLGIPYDKNSSYMRGPALAPDVSHDALHSSSSNLCTENGIDLGTLDQWIELGNLSIQDETDVFKEIENTISNLITKDIKIISLGGDHSITFPILRGFATKYTNLNVLQLDAHPDLYDELDGNKLSHATPFLRSLEEGLIGRLVQLGIRTMTPEQQKRADTFNVETIEMKNWDSDSTLDFDGPVYLTLDIDCLDPAFAPGVSHYEPGGFSTREVLSIIQNINVPIIGADIVEFNPERDPSGLTAMVVAKLIKELIGKML
jgi:agmatinase